MMDGEVREGQKDGGDGYIVSLYGVLRSRSVPVAQSRICGVSERLNKVFRVMQSRKTGPVGRNGTVLSGSRVSWLVPALTDAS